MSLYPKGGGAKAVNNVSSLLHAILKPKQKHEDFKTLIFFTFPTRPIPDMASRETSLLGKEHGTAPECVQKAVSLGLGEAGEYSCLKTYFL